MSLETVVIVSALLEVVTLICFFVLCANVSSIKKKLGTNGADPSSAFAMYIGMGEKEKAKKVLIDMILADSDVHWTVATNPNSLKNVMVKYGAMLKEVDIEFDAEKAFSTRKIVVK